MNENDIKKFVAQWRDHGDEISDTYKFWIGLIRVLGIEDQPENFFDTQKKVEINGHIKRIDAYISSTKVLIEQKSFAIDLNKPLEQSDGIFLTPFEQAKRYADSLDYSDRPRWIVTCNFKEIWIYKNFAPNQEDFLSYLTENNRDINFNDDEIALAKREPIKISVERLLQEYSRLKFLVDPNDTRIDTEVKISYKAAEILGDIYNSFKKRKVDDDILNKLCVRLMFCLYAEDSGIFQKDQFYNYLKSFAVEDRQAALIELFKMLNCNEQNKYNFPYVNGGLFSEKIDVPAFNEDITYYLLVAAIQKFDWRGINPTIFGALFESVLSDPTRRQGGMHYTSISNIHKVIDPLFMDDLNDEFNSIKRSRKDKIDRLKNFQDKLANLKFLDPACGSGNFLTETYSSLRRLENEIIREIRKFDKNYNSIKVSINQFYGIEINNFAVAVAKTAMWIAESQMLQETEMIIDRDLKFLPLKNYSTIVNANALQIDWHEVANEIDFVIGNPPFVGYTYQTTQQKNDLLNVTGLKTKKIDYVSCWYFKAADFIKDTKIRCAFVSTNSICQGEQVAIIWKPLFEKIHIDFARRTFKWTIDNDRKTAAVHCVIIGFSCVDVKKKFIFDGESKILANNINAYLIDAENIFVESRNKPLCNVPNMRKGNQPTDGGNLIIEENDYDYFIRNEPAAKKFIKQLVGAEEFINHKKRYCLWLVDATEDEINSMPLVAKRVEKCRQKRLNSPDPGARKLAERPHLFRETLNPKTFIVVPTISSENRKYIPIGFMNSEIIPSNLIQIIPEANLYHFGILTSSIHMAWMKSICGRFELRYIYSQKIVYNNFVWCSPSRQQKRAIENTAQNILFIRRSKRFQKLSLAKLYDPKIMPEELLTAHQENDLAVMNAYGFDQSMTESEIVAELMKLYQSLTKK